VKEQELNVPLLADVDLAVAKSYGVTGWIGPLARLAGLPDAPGGRYVMRAIFVVDGEGIVRGRTVSRTGSSYETVESLERMLASIA
jgi:peroxiredoxin